MWTQKEKAIPRDQRFQYHTERSDPNDDVCSHQRLAVQIEGDSWKKNHITIMYPTAMRRLVELSHSDILAFYNHKIRGLLNYYSFAGNGGNLQKVISFLVTSCALNLALEWKLRTRKNAFNRAHFLCPNTRSSLNIPNNYKVLHHYKMKSPMATPDSVIQVSWAEKYKFGLGRQVCTICGEW